MSLLCAEVSASLFVWGGCVFSFYFQLWLPLSLIIVEQQQTLMCVTSCSVSSCCTLVINLKGRQREETIMASFFCVSCVAHLNSFSFTAASGFTGSTLLISAPVYQPAHTSRMCLTSFFCSRSAGLSSSRRHARPARPHQLHAPSAAPPPLHVPLIVSVPHPAAGLQPVSGRHRWSEVSASRHTGSGLRPPVPKSIQYQTLVNFKF